MKTKIVYHNDGRKTVLFGDLEPLSDFYKMNLNREATYHFMNGQTGWERENQRVLNPDWENRAQVGRLFDGQPPYVFDPSGFTALQRIRDKFFSENPELAPDLLKTKRVKKKITKARIDAAFEKDPDGTHALKHILEKAQRHL